MSSALSKQDFDCFGGGLVVEFGEEKIDITLRYSHLSGGHKRRVVQTLGRINGTNLAQNTSPNTLTEESPIGYAMQ